MPFGLRLAGSNRIYFRASISGGNLVITRCYHYTDAGAAYASVSQTITRDTWYYAEIHFKAATGAGNNDGDVEFWINGTSIAHVTGIDSDTVTIDRIYAGNFGTMIPTAGS